jgi:peptide/nickel transport system substrate-binding protein
MMAQSTSRLFALRYLGALLAACLYSAPCTVAAPIETPFFAAAVDAGELRPISERVPREPLFVKLDRRGLSLGKQGGELRTLFGRGRDIRYLVVMGYARLIGYSDGFQLTPDILKSVDVSEDLRTFTLHLRDGHRWSDGHPFTTEDFRYYWEDVALNEALSPSGPPISLTVDGRRPTVDILNSKTVRFSWPKPNPKFLPLLAQARPPFIYRPAHYLKQFHADYRGGQDLAEMAALQNVRNWAALHNRKDNMYDNDVVELPTLQPWVNTTSPPSTRFIFQRNPYYHRVDSSGRQLPYLDRVIATIADPSLIPAKAISGETDLQARGIAFSNITSLKSGEKRNAYRTFLWPIAKASNFALYPNLNARDPVWRAVLQEPDFRRALSLAVNRDEINKTLFFGLATEGGNTLLDASPLYDRALLEKYSTTNIARANELLDEMGLTDRDKANFRRLPDGRRLEIIVETAGEKAEETDILQLLSEAWAAAGVKLSIKTTTRDVLRNRAYSGGAIMTMWSGWDNGVATADMSPSELAPVAQENFAWPKWGQHFQTNGQSGTAPTDPHALELLALYQKWLGVSALTEQQAIWRRMLEIHADQQFVIGIVSGVLQPIVVSNRLRNVPENGIYSWNPGAHFGVFRPDQFWMDTAHSSTPAENTAGGAGQ